MWGLRGSPAQRQVPADTGGQDTEGQLQTQALGHADSADTASGCASHSSLVFLLLVTVFNTPYLPFLSSRTSPFTPSPVLHSLLPFSAVRVIRRASGLPGARDPCSWCPGGEPGPDGSFRESDEDP